MRWKGASHGIARVRQEAEGNTAEVSLTFLWPEVSRGLQQESNKAIQNQVTTRSF